MGDIDIFEINEAFASQATYCVRCLEVPKHKLNPKGREAMKQQASKQGWILLQAVGFRSVFLFV